jgi:hypothetical protein
VKLESAFWAIAIAIGLIPTAKAELRAQTTAAHPAPTAIERLDHFQASIRAARQQHDWQAYLGSARQQSQFLNGAPVSRLEVARAEVLCRSILRGTSLISPRLPMTGQCSL